MLYLFQQEFLFELPLFRMLYQGWLAVIRKLPGNDAETPLKCCSSAQKPGRLQIFFFFLNTSVLWWSFTEYFQAQQHVVLVGKVWQSWGLPAGDHTTMRTEIPSEERIKVWESVAEVTLNMLNTRVRRNSSLVHPRAEAATWPFHVQASVSSRASKSLI